MVTNTTVNVDMQAKGLDKMVKDSAQVNTNLQNASKAASKTGARPASQTSAYKAGMEGAIKPDELAGYGVARSTVGTGAASRDFAKQAQGLGGLVHLYATFAANLFAVSTAFNALSKAMDTSNMVKGLDQLGAANGRNLGSLSKRIVDLTDGALSLRDAMEATAKSSAAGFSTKQIESLTTVAKNSSQALGINMVDAMSRLTRAASKLEPELIDELGLMTKIGPATETYAKSVGKATTNLTEFERRQAFVNAIIEEGTQKFGAIELDANPYNKLLASLQNITQSGLELINKVLVPITSLLATSPTALISAMGLVISTLVKQALPAIGAIRENAQRAEAIAKDVSDKRIKAAQETVARISAIERAGIQQRLQDQIAAQDKAADAAAQAVDTAEGKLRAALGSKQNKGSAKILKDISAISIDEISKDQLAQLDKLGAKSTKAAEGYRAIATAIRDAQTEHEKYVKTQQELDKVKDPAERAKAEQEAIDKLANSNRTYQREVEARRKAEEKYAQYRIKTAAIENTQVLGMRYAWQELGKDISKARAAGDIGPLAAGWSKVTGAISIATTAALGFASAINTAFIVIGALAAVFAVLSTLFSKNAKQAEAFASSVDKAEGSVHVLGETLDFYSKGSFKNWFTTESIVARSNALRDLMDNLEEVSSTLSKSRSNRSWFDSLANAGWGLIGKSEEQKAAKNMAAALSRSIQSLDTKEAQDAAKKKISEIFGTNINAGSNEEILNAIKGQLDPETAIANVQKATAAIRPFTDAMSKAAQIQGDAAESLKNINQSYVDLGSSLRINTPLSNFATSILKESKVIEDALKDPINSIATLKKIAADPRKLALLDPADAKSLQELLPVISENMRKVQEARDTLSKRQQESAEKPQNPQLKLEVTRAEAYVKEVEAGFKGVDERFRGSFTKVAADMATIITKEFDTAVKLAKISLSQFIAGGLQGPGAATIQSGLKQQEIEVQLESIRAIDRLTSQLEQNTAAQKLQSTNQKDVEEGTELVRLLGLSNRDFISEFRKILAKDAKDRSSTEQAVVSQLMNTFQNKLGVESKAQSLLGEKRKTQLEAGFGETKANDAAKAAAEASSIANNKTLLDLRKQSLTNLDAENKSVFDLLNLEENLLRARELDQAITVANNNLLEQQARIDKLGATTNVDELNSRKKIIDAAKAQVSFAEKAKETQLQQLAVAQQLATIDRDFASRSKKLELEYTLAQIQRDRLTSATTQEEQLLSVYKEQGYLSASTIQSLDTELSKNRELLASKQAIADLDKDKATKQDASKQVLSKQLVGAKTEDEKVAAVNDFQKREQEINSIYEQRTGLINENTAASLKYLDNLGTVKKEQIGINRATEDLSIIFDNLGSAIGDSVKSLLKFGKGSKDLEKVQKTRLDQIKKEKGLGKEYSAQQEKDAKERTAYELDSAAEIVGSTKKMFAEKTFAYKAFSAVEKSIHVIRLAMWVQENAADIGRTAISVIESGKRAIASGTEAVIKALNTGPGPIGWAAAAITAAIVASLLGGGKKVNTAGMTAADRQETQGTGTEWKDGQKVETGRGVFGDSGAKSESIAKSIEVIKNTSVEGLTYSNKMLDALVGIKDAIAGTAKSLYTITGIRSGSAFGTQDSQKSTSGITGLWGKTTSKDIIDSGIKLTGTFAQLSSNAQNAVSQYETLLTTVKKSGFLGIGSSTSTSVQENVKNADSQITTAIEKIFTNATQLFTTVGAEVGMSATDISNKLSQIPVSVTASLKGLSGADLEKEFSAIISSVLDDAASALFSNMKKYQEFGEGLLETVIRVTDSNKKVKLSFDSIGKAYGDISYDVSESLLKMMGGLETFLDQVSSYKDTFLTDAEKLNPIRTSVTKTMTELGYATVDTRAEFKALVSSIDITTTEGQKLFKALMEVSDSFGQVTAKHQELIDEYTSLEDELLSKFKNNASVKAEIAKREVKDMTDLEKAQFLANKTLQDQIDFLEEYYNLADDLVSAQEDLLSESDKLVAVRNRERSAIIAANQPVYDLVKAYEDLKSANENMKSSLASMQSSLNSIASAAEAAANRLKSAGQALSTGYKSAQDKSTNAQKATQSAMSNIAKGYLAAKAAVVSASSKITEAQNQAAKALRDTLRQLSISIRDFIIQTSTSELGINTPSQNVAALQGQFSDLLAASRGGDTVAMGKLTGVSEQLLTASKEQATSALDYARTYGMVIGALDEISNSAAAMAGPAEDETQSQILAGITELNAANEDLLIWQKAINDTGIDANKFAESTQSTVDELLKTLADAKLEQASAVADERLWQDKLAAAGIDTAKFTEDTAANIDKLIKEYQDAFTANNQAQADLLEAQRLTKNYTFETASELKNLRTLAEQYEAARELAAKSQQIIDTTNTQAIVDSINNMAKSITDKLPEPTKTVSIPSTPTPVQAAGGNPTDTTPKARTYSFGEWRGFYETSARDQADNAYKIARLGAAVNESHTGSDWYNLYEQLASDKADNAYKISRLPSFDVGTDFVPEDMIAQIHKGERIVPARYNNNTDEALLAEVKALREEVAKLRMVNDNVEFNTRKTKDMLQQVTQGNDYVLTKAAA